MRSRGQGGFGSFYQCDADTVGAASVAADAEICAMLADALEAVGIARGDYVIRVNNRKVLNGVMEVAGILDPADPSRFEAERGIVLRAIDKLDRLGVDGVRALLGEGRKDESGDFTKGAGLDETKIAHILKFAEASKAVDTLINDLEGAIEEVFDASFEDLSSFQKSSPSFLRKAQRKASNWQSCAQYSCP